MHFHDGDKLPVTLPVFVACVLGARRSQARRDKELMIWNTTWALLRIETLVKDLAFFHSLLGATWGPLGTETLVKALACFISFWAQHGPPGAETLVNA